MSKLTWMYKTTRWLNARALHLMKFPLCEACKRAGRIEPATVVHHKVPHQGNWVIFLNPENFESLCAPCHDGAAQRSDSCGYDVSVAADGWPKDINHPTVKKR